MNGSNVENSVKNMLKRDYEQLTGLSFPIKVLLAWQCPLFGIIAFTPEIKCIGKFVCNCVKDVASDKCETEKKVSTAN